MKPGKWKIILFAGAGLIAVLIITMVALFYGMQRLTIIGGSDSSVITFKSAAFSNLFLIKTTDGYIMVDAGLPDQEKLIGKKITELGIDPGDISLIIITHSHDDHYGTLAYLKQLTGADVLCHRNAVEYIKTGDSIPAIPQNRFGAFLNKIHPKHHIEGVKPDIVIEDEFDLEEYGIEGKVIHTPGHTSDSVSIVLASGIAFIADMFRGKPNELSFGPFYEDEAELKISIEEVASYNPEIIYLSHGEVIDNEEFMDFIAQLR